MPRKKPETRPVEIPAPMHRFAVSRIGPLVREHLEQRSSRGGLPSSYGLPAPTDHDLAAAAYVQGIYDVAQLLREKGALDESVLESLTAL